MTQPMSDRAEQAKALNEYAQSELKFPVEAWDEPHDLVTNLAAALTASEAEVTRLETGIAEALTLCEGSGEVPRRIQLIRAALSQPTTDTNGAHA